MLSCVRSSSSDAVVELQQQLNELKKHLRAGGIFLKVCIIFYISFLANNTTYLQAPCTATHNNVVESQGQLNDIQQRLKSQEQQLSLVVNLLKSTVGSSSNKQSK